jgi:osmotically-inducible protein OsmY
MIQPDASEMLVPWEEDKKADSGDTAIQIAEILEDLRLAESVERAFRTTGYLPLHAIQVFVCGRAVILQGYVPSYYLKQIATLTALSVLGVEKVRNDLEVVAGQTGR